ncbi:hypothetical protein [Kitasatospora cineracea]|nr:hypothetical protein [Kitasatospora cineracea]
MGHWPPSTWEYCLSAADELVCLGGPCSGTEEQARVAVVVAAVV